jgi:hypothetical protein
MEELPLPTGDIQKIPRGPYMNIFTNVVTAAVRTTRSTFKIEDHSRSPEGGDFGGPDEGFGLEGTPKPKIQRDPSPPKNLICGPPLYVLAPPVRLKEAMNKGSRHSSPWWRKTVANWA